MTIAVFIIFMATLALVEGVPLNCLDINLNDNERFLCKHTLQRGIPTNVADWTTYLTAYGLCYDNTRTTQTFMTRNTFVKKGFCKRDTCTGRTCTSDSLVPHYIVSVSFINNNNCRATGVVTDNLYVVVVCKTINNLCLPVHFEGTKRIKPTWTGIPCSNMG